jgi:alanine-synthesizing transaminase
VPYSLEPNAWTSRLSERSAAGARLLNLTDMNPTRLGLVDAAAVAECVRRASNDPRAARYEPDPRGLLSARQAIAAYYGSRGTPVEPNRIVLTSGTSESYAHLFRLLASPGETVLVPAPSYPLFEPIAAVAGARVAHYRLANDGAWHLDAESLQEAFRDSASPVRAVVVVQPNHPTGSCLAAEELVVLEELCQRYGAALISDEVFGDFPWPGWGDRRSLPSLLGERGVPTFVLGGLSKCCGLPQLKLGWIAACGPDEPVRELMEGLEWIADLFLSVATLPQLALPDLLELRHGFQSRVQARIAENLATLKSAVQQDHSEIGLLDARGGWAAILTMPSRRSGEEWALALLERDVVVHPDHFYDLERTALVVSLIVEPEVLRAALDRLLNVLTTS